MASYGFIWLHMASYDFIWLHVASYGIIWLHMTSYGIIWHHMASYGIIRHHMASYGIIFQLWPALRFTSSLDISNIYGTFRYLWYGQLFTARPASPWGRKPWCRHKEWRCGTVKILPIISTLTVKFNFDIALVPGLYVRHGTFSQLISILMEKPFHSCISPYFFFLSRPTFFRTASFFRPTFFFTASFIVWICPPRPASKLAVWSQVQTRARARRARAFRPILQKSAGGKK